MATVASINEHNWHNATTGQKFYSTAFSNEEFCNF